MYAHIAWSGPKSKIHHIESHSNTRADECNLFSVEPDREQSACEAHTHVSKFNWIKIPLSGITLLLSFGKKHRPKQHLTISLQGI